MALKKEITNAKNVTTVYHRIEAATFEMNGNNVLLTVYSYVDPNTRENEKENIDKILRWAEINSELVLLYDKQNTWTDADKELVEKLEKEKVELQVPAENGNQLNADQKSFTIPFDPSEPMDMGTLYTRLKNEVAEFEGAEDC